MFKKKKRVRPWEKHIGVGESQEFFHGCVNIYLLVKCCFDDKVR